MRRFNPDKELRKIQKGTKNKIIFGVIALLLIISIGSTYALYQVKYSKRIIYTKVAPFSNKDVNIIAVYLDGFPSSDNDFPEKGSGYKFERLDCSNNDEDYTIAYWNYSRWSLIIDSKGPNKCNAYFKKIDKYEDSSGANTPELYQGLIPVTFDNAGKIYVANLEEEWYDYDKHNWANAVLIDASNETIKNKYFYEDGSLKEGIENKEIPMTEILQMYVWIPRYKYQLFNAENGSLTPQEIQIQFESGTSSTGNVSCEIDIKGKETCENAENGNWYTHPAFKFGNTDITGIWVGKFEPSGSTSAITIKPNMASLVGINVETMFNASRNIEEANTANLNLNQKEIDTHMMKNMDWGAMIYLTHSMYGRCNGQGTCTEVAKNTNSSYITGYNGTAYTWETANGQLASTTGNLYGIYDTNGGAWEYVMGNMVNASGAFYSSNAGFSAAPNSKYYDAYEYGIGSTDHKRGHLGDATRETLKTFGNNQGAWYDNYAQFPATTASWFGRGGIFPHNTPAGIFAFYQRAGAQYSDDSFRIVLTAQDGNT